MTRLRQRFGTWEECLAALTPPKLAGFDAVRMRALMAAHHADWTHEAIDGAMACFRIEDDGTTTPRLSLQHHLAILRSMWDDDPARLYDEITVPVLFMPADDPSAAAWSAGRHLEADYAAAHVPVCRVHWFSPAEHDVHAQKPDEVAGVLLDAVTSGFFA